MKFSKKHNIISDFYYLLIFITLLYLAFSILWSFTISIENQLLFFLNLSLIIGTWLTIFWWLFNQYYLIPRKIKMLNNFKFYLNNMFETKKAKIMNDIQKNKTVWKINFYCFNLNLLLILISLGITGFNYAFYSMNNLLTIGCWIIWGSILVNGLFSFYKFSKFKKEIFMSCQKIIGK